MVYAVISFMVRFQTDTILFNQSIQKCCVVPPASCSVGRMGTCSVVKRSVLEAYRLPPLSVTDTNSSYNILVWIVVRTFFNNMQRCGTHNEVIFFDVPEILTLWFISILVSQTLDSVSG